MNNSEFTTWQDFKTKLLLHKEQILQFQYAENQFVASSYHITEIKQAAIVAVDCGGTMNSWTEIIIQLWEPLQKESDRAMTADKAITIVNIVEKKLSLNPAGIVKIEFGNSQFDTRQMYPGEFLVKGDHLTVNLVPDFTQCKAINRGDSCGSSASDEKCCAPVPAKKQEASGCC